MSKQQTIQERCDSIVEDTQGLIDKTQLLDSEFLEPTTNDDTSHVCGRELKDKPGKCGGFITNREFEFDGMIVLLKSYCSNALCLFDKKFLMGVNS